MEESVFSIIWSGVPAAAAEAGAGGEGEGGGAQACQGTCQDKCMYETKLWMHTEIVNKAFAC